jgi:hypothetical protein
MKTSLLGIRRSRKKSSWRLQLKSLFLILMQFATISALGGLVIPSSNAETLVRVHLINARDGKPIPRKPVEIRMFDAPSQSRSLHLEQVTDSGGIATFIVSDPLPESFEIYIGVVTGRNALQASRNLLLQEKSLVPASQKRAHARRRICRRRVSLLHPDPVTYIFLPHI